jgi:tetratricopeptide (TPR) repeat protein
MRSIRRTVCFIAVAGLRLIAAEPGAEWSRLVAHARAQEAAGNYADAEATLRTVLKETDKGQDWKRSAETLGYLGRVEQTLGRLDLAESLYQQALKLNESHNSQIDEAAIQVNLARIARTKGHPELALPLCESAIRTFQNILGPGHPFVADALDTLASVQVILGNDRQASETFERSLAIREKTSPPNPLKLAATLSNFASLQTTLGHYQEAEASYRRALTLRERGLGDAHPEVAETRLGLLRLYRVERQFTKADSLAGLILPVLTASLGPDHPRVANANLEIAALDQLEGRGEEAEPLLRRAMAIYEKSFGPDYGQIAVALTALSGLEVDRHNYRRAEELCLRALDIGQKAFGLAHPEYAAILHKLGLVYLLEERYAESTKSFEQALAIRKTSGLESDSGTAHWEMDYALSLRKIHRNKEATQIEERARRTLADATRETGEGYRVDIKDLERTSKSL